MAFAPVSRASGSPASSRTAVSSSEAGVMSIFDNLGREPEPKESQPPVTDNSSPSQQANNQAPETADAKEEVSEEAPQEQGDTSSEDATSVIEVKADGKTVKFKLDKDDKELQRTLSWGAVAPRLAKKNKELQLSLSEIEGKLPTYKEHSQKYEDATDLLSQGYYEGALKAVFGEDGFKKLYSELVLARIDFDSANPEERLTLREKNMERNFSEREYLLNKRGSSKKANDSETAAKAEADALTSMGTSVAATFSFDGVDKPTAKALEQKLWSLAWADVEEWITANEAEGRKVKPSKAILEKAFSHNHRLLTGGRNGAKSNDGTPASSSASKEQAKKAASENYARQKNEDDESQMSPLAIFKKLGGKLI